MPVSGGLFFVCSGRKPPREGERGDVPSAQGPATRGECLARLCGRTSGRLRLLGYVSAYSDSLGDDMRAIVRRAAVPVLDKAIAEVVSLDEAQVITLTRITSG